MTRPALDADTINAMNEAANSVVMSLMNDHRPEIALTILGMISAKMLFACAKDRADFDETCQVLAKQIQDMINAEEAADNFRWEKAD